MSDAMKKQDVRWRQRFQNFNKAFSQLSGAAALAQQRPLSELEQQGLIQVFEFTHELAWNTLKDFLEDDYNLTPDILLWTKDDFSIAKVQRIEG